jgi:hypothetical protein
MKIKFIILIILSFIILGCSNNYFLNRKSPDSFIDQLDKEKASADKIEITTSDQKKIMVKDIQVVKDTIFGEDLNYYKIYKIGFDEIQTIKIKGRPSATKGFFLGFLIGSPIGISIGMIGGGIEGGVAGLILAPTLGIIGGIIGSISGGVGQQYVFYFNNRGKISPQYYVLNSVQILNETESTIQIKWHENVVWLEKSKIKIIKTDDGTDIRIPEAIYKEKFSK